MANLPKVTKVTMMASSKGRKDPEEKLKSLIIQFESDPDIYKTGKYKFQICLDVENCTTGDDENNYPSGGVLECEYATKAGNSLDFRHPPYHDPISQAYVKVLYGNPANFPDESGELLPTNNNENKALFQYIEE